MAPSRSCLTGATAERGGSPGDPSDTIARGMDLQVFADNPYATNCWLLSNEGSEEAVVIDPGFSPHRVRALLAAAGKRAVAVLATHGHFDHVWAAAEMCGTDVPC